MEQFECTHCHTLNLVRVEVDDVDGSCTTPLCLRCYRKLFHPEELYQGMMLPATRWERFRETVSVFADIVFNA